MTPTPSSPADQRAAASDIIAALDAAPYTRRHRLFVATLLAALMFDYMKPYTISFVIPGMRAMWGLSPTAASYLAVAGLTGTAIGSIFWGVVADRIGRRPTLLWTVAIFSVASLCGISMTFEQTLLACFVMGFGVGGEMPIVFALAAEYLPVASRARALLFLGIVGALGGYALAAMVATVSNMLFPLDTAWRAMWLINILPGLIILVLRSRVVPESARFLLARGRTEEAARAAEALVGRIAAGEGSRARARVAEGLSPASTWTLSARTAALAFFSFGWGLANFGFLTWLPTLLGRLGYSVSASSGYLALSALVALPALALTGLLITRWSTRWTLVSYAIAGAGILFLLGAGVAGGWMTTPALVILTSLALLFMSSLGGSFSLYAAEVFPTTARARRSGLVAGAGKVGGVVGPYLGGLWLAAGRSEFVLQVPFAVALAAGALLLAMAGVETRGRSLESI